MIVAASFDIKNPEQWVNRGLSYGDGLFETMRLNHHQIPLLDYHQNRLNQDLKKLHLDRFDWNIIRELLKQEQLTSQSAILKLTVFRASQARTYMPQTSRIEWFVTLSELPQSDNRQAIRLALSKHHVSRQPLLAGIKHLSRLEQVLLCAELNQHSGIDDVLLLDDSKHIIETGYQNILVLKEQQIISPKLDQSGVEGVALKWLDTNHDITYRRVDEAMLRQCDALMVCNSVRGFRLVESIQMLEKQRISFGTSHPFHDKISNQWDALFNT